MSVDESGNIKSQKGRLYELHTSIARMSGRHFDDVQRAFPPDNLERAEYYADTLGSAQRKTGIGRVVSTVGAGILLYTALGYFGGDMATRTALTMAFFGALTSWTGYSGYSTGGAIHERLTGEINQNIASTKPAPNIPGP